MTHEEVDQSRGLGRLQVVLLRHDREGSNVRALDLGVVIMMMIVIIVTTTATMIVATIVMIR